MFEEPKAPSPTERRGSFFSALTGRKDAEVSGKSDNTMGMLRTLFSKSDGKINTRQAAKDLGVSQRTIQRWVKGTQHPKTDNLARLNTKSRQAATTKAGRRKAVAQAHNGKFSQKGAKITIRGHQGVPGSNANGDKYARYRAATLKMTPDEMQDLMHAYAETGDAGVHDFLQQHYSNNYGAGEWNMDFINKIDISDI